MVIAKMLDRILYRFTLKRKNPVILTEFCFLFVIPLESGRVLQIAAEFLI